MRVGDRRPRVGQVLEQLAGDDDVERLVRERQPVLDVRPHRLDAEPLLCLGERLAVDVDADDAVPVGEVLRQRAGAAAEIEDREVGSADEAGDQPGSVVGAEDELSATGLV